jgi:hypothetical protein
MFVAVIDMIIDKIPKPINFKISGKNIHRDTKFEKKNIYVLRLLLSDLRSSGASISVSGNQLQLASSSRYFTVTCKVVRVTKWRVLFRMIGFIGTFVTISVNHIYYSTIADRHIIQFTVTH